MNGRFCLFDTLRHLSELAKTQFNCPTDKIPLKKVDQQIDTKHSKLVQLHEQLKPISDQLQKALKVDIPAYVQSQVRK